MSTPSPASSAPSIAQIIVHQAPQGAVEPTSDAQAQSQASDVKEIKTKAGATVLIHNTNMRLYDDMVDRSKP